jgi:hypothetical protein
MYLKFDLLDSIDVYKVRQLDSTSAHNFRQYRSLKWILDTFQALYEQCHKYCNLLNPKYFKTILPLWRFINANLVIMSKFNCAENIKAADKES